MLYFEYTVHTYLLAKLSLRLTKGKDRIMLFLTVN